MIFRKVPKVIEITSRTTHLLSTISSGLNALAAVALKDFVSPKMRQNLGQQNFLQILIYKL